MTVVDVQKDYENLLLTLVSEFNAPRARIWELWADPRQLEQWWGPPGYPATFVEHDLTPGARVTYYMTSPEGERFGGWWQVESATPPETLEFLDGFADPEGQPVPTMPTTTVRVTLLEDGDGTRMEIRSAYATREQMEQVLKMGVVEGLTAAIGQIEALLTR